MKHKPDSLLAANRMGHADGVSETEQALDAALADARQQGVNEGLERAARECVQLAHWLGERSGPDNSLILETQCAALFKAAANIAALKIKEPT